MDPNPVTTKPNHPELEAILEIARLLQSSTDLAIIFKVILEKLIAAGGLEGGVVSLIDRETDKLVVAAADGFNLAGRPASVSINSPCACGQAVRSGQIVRRAADAPPLACAVCNQSGALAIPIPGAAQMLGVMSLFCADPRALPPQFELMAQAVSRQLGLALDRLEVQTARTQEQRAVAMLDEVSQLLAEQFSPDQLVSSSLEMLSKNFPADVTVLVLYDVRQDDVNVLGQVAKQKLTLKPEVIKASMDWLVRRRRTLWLPVDLTLEGFLVLEQPARGSEQIPASLIAAPLIINDRLLGGVILASFKPFAFHEIHANVLTSLANQIAGALEMAEVGVRQKVNLEKLEALYATSQALTSRLQSEDVIELCLDIMAALVNADYATFFKVNRRKGRLEALAQKGFDPRFYEAERLQIRSLDRGLNGQSYRTGRIVSVPDVRMVEDVVEANSTTRAKLVVPFVYGSEVLGTIELESPHVGAFDDADLDVLITLAGQVAIALKNFDLRTETFNDTCAINSLQAAAAALVGQRDIDTLAEVICRAAIEACQGSVAWIGLAGRDNDGVEPVAIVGRQAWPKEDLRLAWGPEGEVDHPIYQAIAEQRVLVWHDLAGVEGEGEWLRQARAAGERAVAVLPMLSGQRAVGVLCVYSRQTSGFSEQQLDLLQAFAGQAAFAIQIITGRDRLSMRNRDLATLHAVVETAASHHPADSLGEILVKAKLGLRFDAGFIYLLDETQQALHLFGQVGLTPAEVDQARTVLLADDLEARWVVKEARAAFSDDTYGLPAGSEFQARALVPLVVNERVCGVLLLAQYQPRTFDVADMMTLNTIGRAISLILGALEPDSRVNGSCPAQLPRRASTGNGRRESAGDGGEPEPRPAQLPPEQLLRVERLSTLAKLLAGVAYEINNPLTSVIGYSQLVERQDLPDETLHDVVRIRQEAQRCAKIVENLLAFVRRFTSEKMMIAINDLIEDVTTLWRYELSLQSIHLELSLPPESPRLFADAHQLQLVVVNLISNAIYALSQSEGHKRLRIAVSQADDAVCLEIGDNGPGIPADQQQLIFEPFYTTRPEGTGTGLGLSICRTIVQQHKGTIEVVSAPGEGATFTVTFPLRSDEAEAGPEPKGSQQPARNSRVLVVDDEAAILELLRRILEGKGYDVDTALSGPAALDFLERDGYDLIIADLRMPEMDGIMFKREVDKRWSDAAPPVLYITGDGVSESIFNYFERDNIPYLIKPFLQEELDEAILQALGPGRGRVALPAPVA